MDDLISRRAAIDALVETFKRIPTTAIRAKNTIEQLPSAQPEPNYCRDCKWSWCHVSVDKHGNPKIYWRCLNWDGETDEEGYCHEWERRTDGSD